MLSSVLHSVTHLLFPRLCHGCGSDLVTGHHLLCVQCAGQLYPTQFANLPGNPVEKMLWGRLSVHSAAAIYYFSKSSLLQRLIHQFKYRNNRALGVYCGELMGDALAATREYTTPGALVPLPLFRDKERKRGYNQAALLCEGIAAVLQIPVIHHAVRRIRSTGTQTHKTRMERWQNMDGVFVVSHPDALHGKHILLVDDVITTGATLEACGNAILEDTKDVRISLATLAVAI